MSQYTLSLAAVPCFIIRFVAFAKDHNHHHRYTRNRKTDKLEAAALYIQFSNEVYTDFRSVKAFQVFCCKIQPLSVFFWTDAIKVYLLQKKNSEKVSWDLRAKWEHNHNNKTKEQCLSTFVARPNFSFVQKWKSQSVHLQLDVLCEGGVLWWWYLVTWH